MQLLPLQQARCMHLLLAWIVGCLRVPFCMCVWLLLPGTYTPFLLVNLRNKLAGRVVLVFVWLLALSGVFISTFLAKKFREYRTYVPRSLCLPCPVYSSRSRASALAFVYHDACFSD